MPNISTDFAEIDYPFYKWAPRIWSKVHRRGQDECWPWLGGTLRAKPTSRGHNPNRYPVISHRVPPHGRWSKLRVHRLIYWLEDASLMPTDSVLHLCNNTLCCNPAHLVIGTKADNSAHMVQSGRSTSKLTWPEVREMRRQYAAGGWTYEQLALEFGSSIPSVHRIVKRQTWKEGGVLPVLPCLPCTQDNMDDMVRIERSARSWRPGRAKLNWSEVREMRRLYAAGRARMQLSIEFGVGRSTVDYVVTGRTWKEA